MVVLIILAQSWSTYIDSSLLFVGLTKKDIAFRNDYTVRDPYRFRVVDQLLLEPLNSIDFINSIEEKFWHSSKPEMFKELVGLYDLEIAYKKGSFINTICECSQLVIDAFRDTPKELNRVFEKLTLFSPGLTSSIKEEKEGEKQSDSLVNFLKENGTKIDYRKVFSAGLRLLFIVQRYKAWGTDLEKRMEKVDGVEGDVLYYENCDFGKIVVGDTGKNIYKKNFAVIIDLGGDDIYQPDSQGREICIIVDKAGNDLYKGGNYSIACGNFGISILIDEEGNDIYSAESFSIGCGVFGCGILIDEDGDDRYFGDTFTQGAGGFGIGVLKDDRGNDIYEAALYAQGFASTYGIGVLGDGDGNDMYVIFEKYIDEIRNLDHYLSLSQGCTVGFRPDLSAGIGLILEKNGNDCYLADVFAQGSSYYYGIGAVIDCCGNDDYVAYDYAQGAGVHIAVGLLCDKKGNDNYVSKGVSQGCGHDLAFGLLHDVEGDDSYVAFELSQGVGNANGIGILIDELGDDSYSVKRIHNTQGYGDFRREYGSIGMLLDIKGKDFYRSGKDNALWKRGRYGIGIDWE